ncbi:MAG TPA: FAD-dependent monooxygenase [Steroidobacteraceae bacterium]|nr:FAD-dependent monooxygenase [Steroidobacteraceae bacterium]
MTTELDVVVVGGGPVGACAAALIARGSTGLIARGSAGRGAPLRVALLEQRRPKAPDPEAPLDPRVVAISRASERIVMNAGAHIVGGPRVMAYETMKVWHEKVAPDSSGVLVFDAARAGEPNLGYILEARLLQAALLDAFDEAGGQLIAAEVRSVQVEPERVRVETTLQTLSARLVIGADGAGSFVRNAVGLTADIRNYGQTAIVATVATGRPHSRTAWQRFMRQGTLAFLPLADGHSSIVWSADNELAESLLGLSAEDFAEELNRASALALGTTRLVSDRISFPLRGLAAQRYVTQRCALIGDAAHVVHPLAGQGMNLGLLDAAALAQLVLESREEREDPGALRVLRRYERWRKSEVAIMRTAIDGFDRLLAHGTGPFARIAQRGLGLVNRSDEIKRLFIGRALGRTGELPRTAL